MATKVQEVVHVKALSKYGFQVSDGSYVNWGKFVKDTDKALVIPGGSYEMDLYVSDKGSRSVNSVIKQTATAPTVALESLVKVQRTAATGGVPGRDFDKEARGKTRCALLEALLSNASIDTTDMSKLFAIVDQGVSYVFGDLK